MSGNCPDCLMILHKHQPDCPTNPGKQEEQCVNCGVWNGHDPHCGLDVDICPHCLMIGKHDVNCPSNSNRTPPPPNEEVEPIQAAPVKEDSTVHITAQIIWFFVLALLVIVGGSSGFFYQMGKSEAIPLPCSHSNPFQVDVKGGGVMLIVPEGNYAVPVLNGAGRPYIRPTDEEG